MQNLEVMDVIHIRFTSMQNLEVMDVIHIRYTSMQKWLDFCSIFTSGVTSMQNLEGWISYM